MLKNMLGKIEDESKNIPLIHFKASLGITGLKI